MIAETLRAEKLLGFPCGSYFFAVNSRRTFELLRAYESRNVTCLEPDGSWPIVWERAAGNHVWDAEGRRYTDLTAAFGVAAAGHGNKRVVKAGREQMSRLLHAMGDVHPHPLKAQLARALSKVTFERWRPADRGKSIFCNSGFEAVETALKTALLATGKPHVVSFQAGYHGLGYGALAVTHRDLFRGPFQPQLRAFGHFVPYPTADDSGELLGSVLRSIGGLMRRHRVGAVILEPAQGRGGINFPHRELLPRLREMCNRHEALLVADEIFTGFGRTGRWFACEYYGVVPDIICVGKGLTGGFPLSACIGKASLMDAAWPASRGEALHTSTFLGHPVGCAMALANMDELRSRGLIQASARLGKHLLAQLRTVEAPRLALSARGLGLMAGLELRRRDGAPASREAFGCVKEMLRRGYIMLPEGEHGNVLSFTPPLTITARLLDEAVSNLAAVLRRL